MREIDNYAEFKLKGPTADVVVAPGPVAAPDSTQLGDEPERNFLVSRSTYLTDNSGDQPGER